MNQKKITLDTERKSFESIIAMQGDNKSRYIDATIVNRSIPLDLTGCTVKFSAIKPDITDIFNDAVISDAKGGKVKIELTNQTLAVPGVIQATLVILKEDMQLSVLPFFITVIENPYNPNAIESKSEYKALNNALTVVDGYAKELQDASVNLEEKYTTRLNNFGSQLDNNAQQIEKLNILLNDYKHLVVDDDWTIALQTALDDGYRLKKNVFANYGNFKLTSTIYVPPLIKFEGCGMNLTNFIIEHDGVGFKYVGKPDTNNPTQSGGGKACDLTIKREQPSAKIEGNYGIHLIGTYSQTTFERIEILDMGHHGFYLYDETKNKGTGNVTFKDCMFWGNIYGYGFCAEGIFSDLLLQGVNSWGNAGAFCFDGSKNNEIGFRGQNITLQGCNNEYNGGWDSASGENTMYSMLLVKNVNNVNINGLVLHSSPKKNNDISYRNHLVVDGCEHLELSNMNIQNKIGNLNGGIVLSNVTDGNIKMITAYSSMSGGVGLTINPNCKNIKLDRLNISGWGTNCIIDSTQNYTLIVNNGETITLKGQKYQGDFGSITTKTIDNFSPSYNKVASERSKYCKIASITLTSQDGCVETNLFVNTLQASGGSYGNMLGNGILNIRCVQTSALGNNPWVGFVYTPINSSNPANDTGKLTLSASNFYYKITNVTSTQSVIEVYYRPSQSWLSLSYYPLTINEVDGWILLLKQNNIDVADAIKAENQNKLILQSDNGTVWQLKINDNGEIVTSKPSVD